MLDLIKAHSPVDAITGTQRVFKVGLDVEVDEDLKHMNTNPKDQKKIQNEKSPPRKKEMHSVKAFKPHGVLAKSQFG